jgi:hypothetical protein
MDNPFIELIKEDMSACIDACFNLLLYITADIAIETLICSNDNSTYTIIQSVDLQLYLSNITIGLLNEQHYYHRLRFRRLDRGKTAAQTGQTMQNHAYLTPA